MIEYKTIQHLIDYTNLDDSIKTEDIKNHCLKAINFDVKAVCIWPQYVKEAKEILQDSLVKICTVVSFPLGTDTQLQKEHETMQAIIDGADEIDMVFNYQLLKANWNNNNQLSEIIRKTLFEEVKSIVTICHVQNKILKVIIESGVLTIPQTIEASKICIQANANYIKTSTGKGGLPGAELEKVKAIKETILTNNAKHVSVKISGGIQINDSLHDYLALDIQRIGIGYKKFDEYYNKQVKR